MCIEKHGFNVKYLSQWVLGNICTLVCLCWVASAMSGSLWPPVYWSRPSSSVHCILQARILELFAVPSCRGSSWPRDGNCISYKCCIDRWALYHRHYVGSPHTLVARSESKYRIVPHPGKFPLALSSCPLTPRGNVISEVCHQGLVTMFLYFMYFASVFIPHMLDIHSCCINW